ncbi:MAG TPA: hypothetical protein PLB91_00675 [Spirochaetales bacterium]|nr:hypothetical protein [Spirochaetales bacterium]HRY56320.1 hypothetical protein [Spirochaetia bacterium]HRZ66314.1 hypothetical protein [Spirochaetia bacterium]
MSHYYYFAATLPTLQFGAAPPLSSEGFLERCSRFASGPELEALRAAVLASPFAGPPPACLGLSPLLEGYYAWERAFRAALARLRAARLGRAAPPPPPLGAGGSVLDSVEAQARAAAQAASPLEGELAVERERWAAIQSFLGYDPFGFEAVAAYRLRLQSLERLASFDAERGDAGYRGVYAAILGAASAIDLSGDPQ